MFYGPWSEKKVFIILLSHMNRLFKQTRNDSNERICYKDYRNYVSGVFRQKNCSPQDSWKVLNTLPKGGAQIVLPARWRHNMAPDGIMLSFSQQLCHLHSSIAVEL